MKEKQEKRTFYCLKHNCFHKHSFRGKPNKTYRKCIENKDNVYKFKDEFLKSELFKMDIKRNWNQYNADYYKRSVKIKNDN